MRKIIDDKGRLFGRISIIDVIVVLVVLVLITAVYIKFYSGDNPITSRDSTEVTYTVRIAAIRLSHANLLREGDMLYSYETGANIGTIKHFEITEAEAVDTLVDGTYAYAKVEDRYDVTMTVVAYCSVSNGRYYIGRTFELNSNAVHRVYTKYNEFFSALVVSMSVEP